MPIPLSLAFWAMNATRRYHTAPVFERPMRLRKIYFARVFAYSLSALVIVGNFVKKKALPEIVYQ